MGMTFTYWIALMVLLAWLGIACVVFAVLGAAAGTVLEWRRG